jgi:hypothetical protein
MRTTIRLDERLLLEAKQVAAQTGRTLTSVIEDALREALARRHHEGPGELVRLVTVGGHGVLPGVDLDDSASLLELMDTESAAP